MSLWEPNQGATDEWYTPKYIFDALGCHFDLDVSPARYGASHVPASRFLEGDGLAQAWEGFVWMNPPFGGRNGLTPWLDRYVSHANGIALTPDRTSAPWFQNAMAAVDMVMFTPKVRFLRPDGSKGMNPSNGTALLAIGAQAIDALSCAAASGLGVLLFPARIK